MLKIGNKLLLCQENRRDPDGIMEIPSGKPFPAQQGVDTSASARFTWQERKHGHRECPR